MSSQLTAGQSPTSPPDLSRLSPRELEIVLRLLAGDRVPLIADSLYLSPSTVRNHLSSVFRKLGVNSQQQLIVLLRAQASGLAVVTIRLLSADGPHEAVWMAEQRIT